MRVNFLCHSHSLITEWNVVREPVRVPGNRFTLTRKVNHENGKQNQKVKEYKVVFFADGSEIGTRNLQVTKQQLWKKLKNWLAYMRERS